MRTWLIVILCNFYPAFVAGHLIWGNWSRLSQVIFNIVPIVVFGGLFQIWYTTSHIRLNYIEKRSIGYLKLMLGVVYCYYILCLYSDRGWIANHNLQFAIFISITLIFYIYSYRNEFRNWWRQHFLL